MKTTLIERLSALMHEKDISQAELSKKTGITQSSLSDYIKGKYSPKQDKIDLIARALNVSPAYLMGWDDENGEPEKSHLEELIQELVSNPEADQKQLEPQITNLVLTETKKGKLKWIESKADDNKIGFRVFYCFLGRTFVLLTGYMPQRLSIAFAGKEKVLTSDENEYIRKLLRTEIIKQIEGESTTEPQKPTTIAAHATADLDEDDMEEIRNFIDYMKSKKKKK